MPFRFRRSIKLFPGFRLNITKRGISSLSIGRTGTRVNLGKKGVTTTLGIPGSGFSWFKFFKWGSK